MNDKIFRFKLDDENTSTMSFIKIKRNKTLSESLFSGSGMLLKKDELFLKIGEDIITNKVENIKVIYNDNKDNVEVEIKTVSIMYLLKDQINEYIEKKIIEVISLDKYILEEIINKEEYSLDLEVNDIKDSKVKFKEILPNEVQDLEYFRSIYNHKDYLMTCYLGVSIPTRYRSIIRPESYVARAREIFNPIYELGLYDNKDFYYDREGKGVHLVRDKFDDEGITIYKIMEGSRSIHRFDASFKNDCLKISYWRDYTLTSMWVGFTEEVDKILDKCFIKLINTSDKIENILALIERSWMIFSRAYSHFKFTGDKFLVNLKLRTRRLCIYYEYDMVYDCYVKCSDYLEEPLPEEEISYKYKDAMIRLINEINGWGSLDAVTDDIELDDKSKLKRNLNIKESMYE